MTTSPIEWLRCPCCGRQGDSWNPTTGCDQVSPGCDFCYAMASAKRWKAAGSAKYQADGDPRTSGPGFGLTMHPYVLETPLTWRPHRRVFVNSMSDLFHPKVSDDFIARVFAVMALTGRHTYLVLTKRAPRMAGLLNRPEFRAAVAEHASDLIGSRPWRSWQLDLGEGGNEWSPPWPLPNLWLGVSVEDQRRADERVPGLIQTPAAVRWISAEPLLGPVDLTGHGTEQTYWLTGRPYWGPPEPIGGGPVLGSSPLIGPRLDWVVVGGESGSKARPAHPAWVRSLRDQCGAAEVGFFMKQWGVWASPDQFDSVGYDDVAMADAGLTMWPDGRIVAGPAGTCTDGSELLWRVGKGRTGHRLDGVEHLESPRLVRS